MIFHVGDVITLSSALINHIASNTNAFRCVPKDLKKSRFFVVDDEAEECSFNLINYDGGSYTPFRINERYVSKTGERTCRGNVRKFFKLLHEKAVEDNISCRCKLCRL